MRRARGHGAAEQPLAFAGEEPGALHGRPGLAQGVADALAGFQGHDLGQLLAARFDQVGDGVQDLAAPHAGRLGPRALSGPGAVDGGGDIGLARARQTPDGLPGGRAQDIDLAAALGGAVGAIDQVWDEAGIAAHGVTSR